MPNCLVSYHMLTKIADGLQNCQRGTIDELEPKLINSFYKSCDYTGANPAGTSRIEHLPNTGLKEVTKRQLKNGMLSPLLTIRKNKYRKESKYGSGGNYS